jgi:hypothetical protein
VVSWRCKKNSVFSDFYCLPNKLALMGHGGYKLQMQRNRFELIYSTPVAGAVGKWEARFAFHFSMARRVNGSWTCALTDV